MIHFALVLILGLAFVVVGGMFIWEYERLWRQLGLILCAVGLGGLAYLTNAYVKSSGRNIVVAEKIYQLQELVIPNGTKIQVVTNDDGTILNLTKLTGRVFPSGRVAWHLTMEEPSMGLRWDTDSQRKEEWVSTEVSERQQ